MARRVVSFIPSATEILGALLGPGEGLVGATHECDRPEWVAELPRLIAPRDPELISLPAADIDARVRTAMEAKQPLYSIDRGKLVELRPELVVTQRLCDVCTISADEAMAAIEHIEPKPELLELAPKTLDDVVATILQIGAAVDRELAARALVEQITSRLAALQMQTTSYPLPHVLALEWTDPLWVAGHWVADMIAVAGGFASLSESGEPSRRIDFEEVRVANPNVILIACCGYGLARNVELGKQLLESPQWRKLPAAKRGHVYAIDANRCTSRPSQGLIDGIEAIADILHGSDPTQPNWQRVA